MRTLTVAVASLVLAAAHTASGDSGPRRERPVKLQDVPLTIGTPLETPTRLPQQSTDGRELKIRVDRIWRTGPKTHAAVRVQNTAGVAFNDVTIVCKAVDAANREIGTTRQDIRRTMPEGFKPGSIANLDLVFDTPQTEVRGLVCDARARGLPRFVE